MRLSCLNGGSDSEEVSLQENNYFKGAKFPLCPQKNP